MRLLVVLDGPRPNVKADYLLTSEVRNIVLDVDWECEVDYEIASTNLGIRKRFVSGLDWIFASVSEAIILEDDCLPTPAFFSFQQQMLLRHRDNDDIGIICGFNPIGDSPKEKSSESFSKFSSVWGWGTWRRVWNTYDSDAGAWLSQESRANVLNRIETKGAKRFWKLNFDLVSKNRSYSTWDYQLIFDQLLRERMNAYPSSSLVTNIGFDIDANHTVDASHPLSRVRGQNPKSFDFESTAPGLDLDFDLRLERGVFNLSIARYLALKVIFAIPSESMQKRIFQLILKIRNSLFRK
jgi:hypothetical protein